MAAVGDATSIDRSTAMASVDTNKRQATEAARALIARGNTKPTAGLMAATTPTSVGAGRYYAEYYGHKVGDHPYADLQKPL